MKVIILSSYHSKGGAARATLRLVQALRLTDVTVEYRCIYPMKMNLVQRLGYLARVACDRVPALLAAHRRVMFSFGAPSNSRLVNWINASDADLVHLHWVNGGGLSIADLARIEKPLLWTLHDMWGFTGGCHYDAGCGRFMSGCGRCPLLASSSPRDLSAIEMRQKRQVFSGLSNLTIVALSRWMADCITRSSSMAGLPVVSLPNPIDVDTFSPGDKLAVRARLGIAADSKLVVFGAVAATHDERKGFKLLLAALDSLAAAGARDVELAVFGGRDAGQAEDRGFRIHYLGSISRDEELRDLYSAADVMVVPSRQEAFGQTATEAMACGVPVVAFGVTGLLDIVEHKINGYLCTPFDTEHLAQGIAWVMDPERNAELGARARAKVVEAYSNQVVAPQYVELYKRCLSKSAAPAPLHTVASAEKDVLLR